MQTQYVIVTTRGHAEHETFRFHLGWNNVRQIELLRLAPQEDGERFHLTGVFAFERRMDDFSVYLLRRFSGEFWFEVKEWNAHLRPQAPTPVFTFHRDDADWVCEEVWPPPQESVTHDLVPHGGRGFDALELIVASNFPAYAT